MKKRTNEEKLQMVNDACGLFAEALKTMKQAKKILHLCGIDVCDYINIDTYDFTANSHNVQIFRGISAFEAITGKEANYGVDIIDERKPDKSYKYLEHGGVKFCQKGRVKTTEKYSWR